MSKTIPYRPSNGTEGMGFEAKFCSRCEYDAAFRKDEFESACQIHSLALALNVEDGHFPEEWVSDADGSNPRCTHFRQEGTGTWEQAAADQSKYEAAMAEMRAAKAGQS